MRIVSFVDPSQDPRGAGYQVIQSKVAIGSGGLFGQGFLEGPQKRLKFLPEQHTDFIYAVIGEEMGSSGPAVLLLVYL
jgi:rod shape determining protein RodA